MKRFLVAASVIAAFFSASSHIRAQISSTRSVATGSGDWFNAAAWSSGVPQMAGDSATLALDNVTGQLQLGSSVFLEQLLVSGRGSLTLAGAGPLLFRSDGAGALQINLTPNGGVLDTTVSAPVSLSDSQPLIVNAASMATLQLNGAIGSAAGDLVKQGAGALRLGGNNAAWNGAVSVEAGSLVVAHSMALGSATTGTSIGPAGILVFEQSSAEPLSVNGGAVHVRNVQLTGPIQIDGSALIFRPQNPLTTDPRGGTSESSIGPTTISGTISGMGDLTVQNQSRDPVILGGNNEYTGHTYIRAGQVTAATATALGSSTEGTTINGGALRVQAPTDEQFRIESGELRFAAGEFVPADPVTVAGGSVYFPVRPTVPTAVIVDGVGGGEIVGTGSLPSWTGGSTGNGNLRVRNFKIDAPVTHTGDLTVQGVHLNVANSHMGKTIVTGDTQLNHRGAFGGSTTVQVKDGQLTLNVVPNVNPEYIVERGMLFIPGNFPPVTSAITLGGTFDAILTGGATINGPIHLVPQTGSARNVITSGVVNGRISGEGGVRLSSGNDSTLLLNAANDIRGLVDIGGGNVHVHHAHALNLTNTIVSNGRLHLHVPTMGHVVTNRDFTTFGTVVFSAPQNYPEPWLVNSGALETTEEVGMTNLVVLEGQLRGIEAGAFRLDGDLRVIRSGAIEGGIRGDTDIRLLGSSLSAAGDLTQFTGDFHVHTGSLNFGYLATGFGSPTSLNPESDIHIYEGGSISWLVGSSSEQVLENDIFLHNAPGANGFQVGISSPIGNGFRRLRGHLDIGEDGSSINGSIQIEGPVIGRNLTVGFGGFDMIAPQEQLRGELRIANGGAVNIY